MSLVTRPHPTEKTLEAIRTYVEKLTGFPLAEDKNYLIITRLGHLLDKYDLHSYEELAKRLHQGNPISLKQQVIDAVTTQETSWFRDSIPFEVLQNKIFSELSKSTNKELRIWSAGCANGQEPYSISMIYQEYIEAYPFRSLGPLEIMATDISTTTLNIAKEGVYDDSEIQRGLTPTRHKKFFQKSKTGWKVKPHLLERVNFRQQNLLEPYGMLGRFDVVFCRNVLIYFSEATKQDIISRIASTLRPGGYLILGASESIGDGASRFETVYCRPGILYRRR